MSETRAKEAHVWAQNEFHWYVEGSECTRALLRVEAFFGRIYDPACGRGNVMRACLAHGLDPIGSDVVRRAAAEDGPWWQGERDFLKSDALVCDSIITNPPFFKAKGTEAFIRRGWEVARHKLAIFTDTKFLNGGARAEGLYKARRPNRIWYLSPRPSCPPGEWLEAGNKAGGGTADYCWLVWDMTSPAAVTIADWLRILPEDHAPQTISTVERAA